MAWCRLQRSPAAFRCMQCAETFIEYYPQRIATAHRYVVHARHKLSAKLSSAQGKLRDSIVSLDARAAVGCAGIHEARNRSPPTCPASWTSSPRSVPTRCLFHSMRATESLGRLFDYQLSLLSTRNDIDPKALLGKNATVKVQLPKGGPRHFDGCVTRFALIGSHGRYVRYEMQLRPWVWFLTRAADCRIFQKHDGTRDHPGRSSPNTPTPPSNSNSPAATSRGTTACSTARPTTTSSARLMEQEGIYTYYKHSEGKHTLSSPTPRPPTTPTPATPASASSPTTAASRTEKERILDWAYGAQVQIGQIRHRRI